MQPAELRPTGMWSGTPPGTSLFEGLASPYLKEVNKISLA